MNALVKAEWKHVNEWFQEQMSGKVAPIVEDLLKKWHPTIGVVIPLEKCTLGKTPITLERVQSSTITEVLPDGSPIETMRITSQVDFTSDAEMDFVFARVFLMGGNASVKVNGLRIKGTVIVELVQLSKDPPWFSAVRVYFPDLPTLDFDLEAHVTFGESILPLGFIKAKIIMAITEMVIGKFAVLPNRFCVPLGDRIELFPLKHAHPAGVLRVIVEEAENLRVPGSSGWGAKRGEANASPYVQLWAGHQSARTSVRKEEKTLKPKWKKDGQPYEVHDLLVAAPQMQSLKIRVCDDLHGIRSANPSPLLGQAELSIREYVNGSKGGRERFQLTASDSGRAGVVWLCIEWRPFAEASGEGSEHSPWKAGEGESEDSSEGCWTHGPPDWLRHSLLLSVHLYCGIGLPHDADDVIHYASVSVCAKKAGRNQEQKWAPEDIERRTMAPAYTMARTPEDHGEILVRSRCGESARQTLDDGSRRRLGRHLWRSSLWIPEDKMDIEGTDAVWDVPFRFMVDSLENVKVRLVMGTGEAKGKDDKVVLAGELSEAALREVDFGHMQPTFHNFTCNDGGIFTNRETQVKLVVHVRRLLPPVQVRKTRTALAKATLSSAATLGRRSIAAAPANTAADGSSAAAVPRAVPRWQFWRRRQPNPATVVPVGALEVAAAVTPEVTTSAHEPLLTSYFAARDFAG